MRIGNSWRFTLTNLREYGASGVNESDFKSKHKLHKSSIDQMWFKHHTGECPEYFEEFGDHKIRISGAGRESISGGEGQAMRVRAHTEAEKIAADLQAMTDLALYGTAVTMAYPDGSIRSVDSKDVTIKGEKQPEWDWVKVSDWPPMGRPRNAAEEISNARWEKHNAQKETDG